MKSTSSSRAEHFGKWLRAAMERRQMRPTDLARETGRSKGVVGTWYRGERVPNPESCDLIADALRIPVDDVLDVAGHRSRSVGIDHASAMVRELQPYIDAIAWDDKTKDFVKNMLGSLAKH